MKIFIIKEYHDSRVSFVPELVSKIISLGCDVVIQKGAGEVAGFFDEDYVAKGASVGEFDDIKNADVVFAINPLQANEIKHLKPGAIVIGSQETNKNSENIELFLKGGITSFALDIIPRTTRAQYMDILSSQSSLAGYKAVIEGAHVFNRAMPLMMTSAGTIPAAKVLVIGAGVAGLQAIATAKRLGAVVFAFDVRASAKEQVESLGAKFVEVESLEKMDGVYAKETSEEYKNAQEAKLRSVLPSQDIVITTAQIPGRKAPIIIKKDMIESMKKGSVVIDLASKTGGNTDITEHGKTIVHKGVSVIAFENILNLIAYDASRLFAKNIFAFFELLQEKMKLHENISEIDDEIIRGTLLTNNSATFNYEGNK